MRLGTLPQVSSSSSVQVLTKLPSGQGFNSYTQQPRLDNAVLIPLEPPKPNPQPSATSAADTVRAAVAGTKIDALQHPQLNGTSEDAPVGQEALDSLPDDLLHGAIGDINAKTQPTQA